MNTAALKKFAPELRTKLMEAVSVKLDYVLSAKTPDYLTTFATQVAALRKVPQAERPALVERVAYTWFNRFVALRFMDARGWHPFRARVLLPANPKETQPELLKLMRTGALPAELRPFTNASRLDDLLDRRIPSTDPQGEVYRHLVLAACRFYNALLPDLFERLDDETELLLPDDLLTEQSVIHGFRTEISDDDCVDGQRANVEIVGWLYQFYISERKDQVMARKSAVPTEDIPAVTQLFTPHWIVRYLVENSLGRLWLLNRPHSKLREQMPYYIEGEAETDFLRIDKPEDLRICDPAVGSGHMLTYAFDLLVSIYEEEGYAASEIPGLILRHNLVGLDICPRAVQLAQMALVFKAREKSRRFFQAEHFVRPQIVELRDVKYDANELSVYFNALRMQPSALHADLVTLLHQFEEAKNFGSLIQPCMDEAAIVEVRGKLEAKDVGSKELFLRETHAKVLRVLAQAEALTQRYQVVVANPPYMGSRSYHALMKEFVKMHFADASADLYGCFMQRNLSLVPNRGIVAMITIPNWMFLSTFEDLRIAILQDNSITTLLHNGRGVWGSDFGSCSFVIQRGSGAGRLGLFRRLFRVQGEVQSNSEIQSNFENLDEFPIFRVASSDFLRLPSAPVAYWVGGPTRAAFNEFQKFGDFAETRLGMATADNNKFLRRWPEVDLRNTSFASGTRDEALRSGRRWFPYAKGGEFRKWYGNNEYVVDWARDGEAIRNFTDQNGKVRSHNYNLDHIFRSGITWNALSSSDTSMRVLDCSIFDNAGSSCFPPVNRRDGALAFLNSKLLRHFIQIISPTFNYQPGDIARVPLHAAAVSQETVNKNSIECVSIARSDWDSFEASWDFRDLPLLRPDLKAASLEASWKNWEKHCQDAIRRMQELETENNRLFIAAYGLQDELQPDVPEEQITLARADVRKDVAAFLSYAIGCMMGRYSLDHPGLILANAGDTVAEYLAKVGKTREELTFVPDEDGILPIVDGEWFEDDLVARTRDFLRTTFGEANLRENLRFIEQALGKDLRKYFLTDFYKDHLQTYKKRPIYWMIQSPKKGFCLLLYLHRYTRDTMNLVLNRYLRDYLVKLRTRLAHLTQVQATAASAGEKTQARKEADKLQKTLLECEEWERQTMLPLAQQRIDLDLDDGVKTNYLKLGDAVAPIPGLAATDE